MVDNDDQEQKRIEEYRAKEFMGRPRVEHQQFPGPIQPTDLVPPPSVRGEVPVMLTDDEKGCIINFLKVILLPMIFICFCSVSCYMLSVMTDNWLK